MANKSRKNKISLILLIGMIVIYLIFFKNNNRSLNRTSIEKTRRTIDHREKGFRHNRIYYTVHAKCRMDCRQIDESEVKEILVDGKINYAKSELKAKGCPKYALEGITHDKQNVRIIVGDCESQASIITVIDLDTDFECDCK